MNSPLRTILSSGLMLAARTSTSTSPGAHRGHRDVAQLEPVGAVAGDDEGLHSDSWVGVNDGEGEAPAMVIAFW